MDIGGIREVGLFSKAGPRRAVRPQVWRGFFSIFEGDGCPPVRTPAAAGVEITSKMFFVHSQDKYVRY